MAPLNVVPPDDGHAPSFREPALSLRVRRLLRAAAALAVVVGVLGCVLVAPRWFFVASLVLGVVAAVASRARQFPVVWSHLPVLWSRDHED